ncbi:MAG: phytanoyl-CoA dioxygenase family protein [Gammaproteobacteria bacterium]|nr:phytanoyl-CoA dioxygenase family protein [Gammaproteobacteria bacterium]MYD79372.1 phytanoyl-CoA dioxygenase family protein [Gammaproteobacteria bacterium]
MQLQPVPAQHRQTNYIPSPLLDPPVVLPLPSWTSDIDEAKSHLSEYGMCVLTDVLASDEIDQLRHALERQSDAERLLDSQAPPGANSNRQSISNLVNKGKVFLDLVEHSVSDNLAGFLLGKSFLLSSITGNLCRAPVEEPQPLHRDQGYVPATVDFPAACNLLWCLDDFCPENGGTCVVPGSHRWHAEFQVKPPPRELSVQITAPVGSVFAWDGRVWHGYGPNETGEPRRAVITYYCLPWVRQQENWGISCLQEVLDEASPKLRNRMGLHTYGTLGGISGTRTTTTATKAYLGNYDVELPSHIIGEAGKLHRLRRVSRID